MPTEIISKQELQLTYEQVDRLLSENWFARPTAPVTNDATALIELSDVKGGVIDLLKKPRIKLL